MKVLFISRKRPSDIGGLSRFYIELTSHFPGSFDTLSPDNYSRLLNLPYWEYDIIHLCDATLLPLGFLLKTIFGTSLTVSAHGLDLTYNNRIYQYMLKKLLPKSDRIILDSEPAEALTSKFNIPKSKITVIHLGVSVDHLKSTRFVKLTKTHNVLRLVTIGNLVARKGHAWFIREVLTKISFPFVYYIVGDGRERKAIANTIKKYNLQDKVYLPGQLNHQELGFVFRNVDICVSPNIPINDNFESFGIANLEAASLGLPVLTSKVDGIGSIMHNYKNGLVVEPTAKAYLEALLQLKDKSFRLKLGAKAAKYTLANYSWSKTCQKYFNLFQELVDIPLRPAQRGFVRYYTYLYFESKGV